MRWALALLLLACAGLAGCASQQGKPPVTGKDCDLEPALCDPDAFLADHHCLKNDVRPRVYAPDTPGPDSAADPWVQGDFWTYRLSVDGQTSQPTIVYYDDIDVLNGKAQHYLVGTADRDEALRHAVFSVNPMLGRIHRTLYSPHESGAHADMFHFPLCAGSTWTTPFYATQFQMAATPAPVPLPDGTTDAGFRIDGTGPDGATLTILYSPRAKWFSELETRLADGLEVSMVLTAWGSGKSGRHEFLRAQKDETVDLATVGRDGVDILREDGGEGPYDLLGVHLALERAAGTGRLEAHLRDPSGASRACVGIPGQGLGGATACPRGPLLAEVPYQAGTWSVTVERFLLDTESQASGEARIVSMYDRGGTV